MNKKIVLALLAAALLIGCSENVTATENTNNGEKSLEYYRMLSDDLGIIEIYDSEDLTLEMLQNRNGKLIIERCIGMVTSPEGDGTILDCDDEYYYISYSSMEDIEVGDVIVSYFLYNPDTNYEDDVLERFDYVIDKCR